MIWFLLVWQVVLMLAVGGLGIEVLRQRRRVKVLTGRPQLPGEPPVQFPRRPAPPSGRGAAARQSGRREPPSASVSLSPPRPDDDLAALLRAEHALADGRPGGIEHHCTAACPLFGAEHRADLTATVQRLQDHLDRARGEVADWRHRAADLLDAPQVRQITERVQYAVVTADLALAIAVRLAEGDDVALVRDNRGTVVGVHTLRGLPPGLSRSLTASEPFPGVLGPADAQRPSEGLSAVDRAALDAVEARVAAIGTALGLTAEGRRVEATDGPGASPGPVGPPTYGDQS